jgi:hypothetical protein
MTCLASADTLMDALGVEDAGLSAAILDHTLSNGDSPTACRRMNERKIPFLTYSGYDAAEGPAVMVYTCTSQREARSS